MRINALGNTATDFESDDYIAIDGATNATRKMSKDDLLKETAQNALAGNVAPAFDPTRTSDNPYKAGESVAYNGKTYTFKVDHYGAWAASDVVQIPSVYTCVAKDDLVQKFSSASETSYAGGITHLFAWVNLYRHCCFEVSPGDKINITMRSPNGISSECFFVDYNYTPGDHTTGAATEVIGQRYSVSKNSTIDVIAPEGAKYLICHVQYSSNVKYYFSISKLCEQNKFTDLLEDHLVEKESMMISVSQNEYQAYTGLIRSLSPDNPSVPYWINDGKHIVIPSSPGDVFYVKPSVNANYAFLSSLYVPQDETTNRFVDFAYQNIERQVANSSGWTRIVAGVDVGYLCLITIAGDGPVTWEIFKSISVNENKLLNDVARNYNKDSVKLNDLTDYVGSPGTSSYWFGTGSRHKALPVNPGEIYEISVPTSYDGYFAVVTSSYTPGNQTPYTQIPFVVEYNKRISVLSGNPVVITMPKDAAYLIFAVVDGAPSDVLYRVNKLSIKVPYINTFQKLRVAHWNIGHFSMGKSPDTTISPEESQVKQLAYRDFINSIHADVLSVCEDNVAFDTDGTLASDAVYSCYSNKNSSVKSGYFMESFYSNGLKILQFGFRDFTGTGAPGGSGGFSEMVVDIGGDSVIFVEAHLTWNQPAVRTDQILFLINRYSTAKYVIMSGDWNIGPNNGGPSEETEMRPFIDAGYRLSMMDYMPKESTYSGNDVTPASDSALDIICAKGFGLINAHVSQDCASLSDHRLVYCDLIKNP